VIFFVMAPLGVTSITQYLQDIVTIAAAAAEAAARVLYGSNVGQDEKRISNG
jgi:predicted amidohydrolase